ncbi:glutamate 2,3-aminomutase [Dethiobacter alkaliphilus]|uniref:Lysine 2,3-aminomutase YodO family protein n=1 Tax=Dethiobacter alkaliphilus AHT 1 TaxID=555088 RepID=C0GIT3_DETAL|nr:glutamate 2,3-aminomutase [Dethiobacter alkaliphilus]EEG76747.1 lysine 2,3-aminomutase YodO family protein [Dethiobacter alkaliphilus AHT 1]MCW3490868.1 glutamate 2,3-aminomutase [Dethiobacter alkaliphilus]
MSDKDCLQDEQKRAMANERAAELKGRIDAYLEARPQISDGMTQWEEIQKRQKKIKAHLNASDDDWNDWHWQVRSRINKVEDLIELLELNEEEAAEVRKVGEKNRWATTPYYLSLMNPDDPNCPVRRQAIPATEELLNPVGKDDPMGEQYTSPAPAITRRYPDRLIINVTNQCGMYCRHCQRRRNIGEVDRMTAREDLQAALDYVRNHPEIRDVLLTGGDALMLNEEIIDWLLTELDNIPHVEIKRLGSRTLVTMPMRVTDELCAVLEKHSPVYINTHFNNPAEVTPAVAEATRKLTRAGVSLGNQAVLLAGVNDDPHVMKKLNHMLLQVMIRPYYIFHAKAVTGTAHFRTRVEVGIEIMEHLRGQTSGMAIPTFIVNAPEGYGKTPMLPEYLISSGRDKIFIRTWENRVFEYDNRE